MTVAAAYLTSEGVVLGADSTTTIRYADGHLQLLNHAQKVFEVGRAGEGRLAVCTWGTAVAGKTSHRAVVARLAELVANPDLTVADAATRLEEIVRSAFKAAKQKPNSVGYFVGGCNADHSSDCWRVEFDERGQCRREALQRGQMAVAGNPSVFMRVLFGYDPDLPNRVGVALVRRVPKADRRRITDAFIEAFNEAANGLAPAGYDDVPIREAIDYVHAFLLITIKAMKFRGLAQICGGPIEVGFVTVDRPFRWAAHKDFGTAIAEQGVIR